MEKKFEAWAMTGLAVLATLIVYNLFIKNFTPTTLRSWIGLG